MVVYRMKLAPNHFYKIIEGSKIIESRLYDEKRRKLNIGDQIIFSKVGDPEKKARTRVRALYRYGSFREMFSDFPLKNFGANSKDRLEKEVEIFYSKDLQDKYGVLGIKIELI